MTALLDSLSNARQLLGQKFYYQSLKVIERALKKFPEESALWELRGLAYRELGNLREALKSIEMATLFAPLSPPGSCLMAECYVAIEKPDLAFQIADNLWMQDGLENPVRFSLAAIFDRIGYTQRSIRICRKAICHDPSDAQGYYDLSFYLGRGGHPIHIVESVARRAIDLDPENVHYRIGLAALLFRASRLRRAHELIRHFSESDIRQIRCACCLRKIIEIYEISGDYDQVQACERHADRLDCDCPPEDATE